ncbi:SAR2788 family putative toxin [Actinomycetaceae bacterium TAE3-ERU4]|nr:SAR2788 family putative toxin [Actinomycetaceae bacterium TAE3-ERU4]
MANRFHWKTLTVLTVSIALSLSATGAASATPLASENKIYSNSEVSQAQQVLGISEAGTTENITHKAISPNRGVVSSDVDAEKVTVLEVEQVDGEATVVLQKDGFINVDVSAAVGDQQIYDSFDVVSLTILDDKSGDYIAELRSSATGEIVRIDTTLAEPQAFPALVVLGAVARVGIKAAIRQYTKTQIKKAAKSYLLRKLNANGWNHIMNAKHNWSLVGARSREQVAEIIGNAMANGSRRAFANHVEVSYWYKGKKIIVRYAKNGGKISDAWVVR